MTMQLAAWAPPILMSALALGFYDITKKKSVTDNFVPGVLFFSSLTGLIAMTIALLAAGCLGEAVCCTQRQLWLIAVKVLIVTSSWACVFWSFKKTPLTIAAPIRGSSTCWSLAGAMLVFGEIPSPFQALGMTMAISGVMISFTSKLEGISFGNRWTLLLLAGTLLGAASALYDKYLLNTLALPRLTVQFYFTLGQVVVFGALLAAFSCFSDPVQGRMRWRWTIPATGLLLLLGDYLYFKAVSVPEARISVLSLIRRCNVVVPFVFDAVFMKELDIPRKTLALVLVLAGVTVLLFASR
ncbi:MAG: DMT family transporter [Victivallaceae bacterium]|nr:DMT family transporter [Victivallaceae bacterium]